MKKVLLTLSLLLISIAGAKAQDTNLWGANPGFEEIDDDGGGNKSYTRWVIGGSAISSFNFSDDAHTGKHSLKLYAAEAKSLTIYDKDWDWIQGYPCKVGDSFVLSYWHKGTMDFEGLEVTIRFYNGTQKYKPIATKKIPGSATMTQKDWMQKVINFTIQKEDIPEEETVKSFDILLTTPYKFNSDKIIFLDDFSLTKGEGAEMQLKAPKLKETRAYEHELELSWEGNEDNAVSWEVVVDGGQPIPVSTPDYIVWNLVEGKEHMIKVRTVKENKKSPYSEIKLMTKPMAKGRAEMDRAPHLRKIAPDGSVQNQQIELFYYDLHNVQNAKITYTIDGKKLTPDGYILRLPKTGLQTLEIRIEEDTEHIWDLVYHLNVFN